MNVAMILSECVNESKLQKKPLYIAALDVQKAFDVVDHDSLLLKLYLDGISGDDWLLMKNLYSNMTAKVKWGVFVFCSYYKTRLEARWDLVSSPLQKKIQQLLSHQRSVLCETYMLQ